MRNDTKFAVTAALIGVLLVGCDADSGDDGNGPIIASLTTDDGVTVEFARLEATGDVIVSEVGPGEIPSKLAEFSAVEATPLEIYLALEPGVEAPSELEANHMLLSDQQPRDLSLDFRGYTGNSYSADCTFTGDSTWYNDTYTGTGWTGGNYYNGISYVVYHNWEFTTQHMITHVCNYDHSGGTAAMQLKEYEYVSGAWSLSYTLSNVYKGYRGVVYLLGASSVGHKSTATGPAGSQTNLFRHGYMIP